MRNFFKDILLGALAEVKDWTKAILGAVIIAAIIITAAWLAPVDWTTHWNELNGR